MQLRLPLDTWDIEEIEQEIGYPEGSVEDSLAALLSSDLDFHDRDSRYASHNFHSFPAKFPPQLPRKFIEALTRPDTDLVLDPMVGSGTTTLEAYLAGRPSKGFDIDPMALLISRTKVASLTPDQVLRAANAVAKGAGSRLRSQRVELEAALLARWDRKTRRFVDYWFDPETQLALLALRLEIEVVPPSPLRDFFDLMFSSTIITKHGGVSLAMDLAHTRPHRAKVVIGSSGQVLVGHDLVDSTESRIQFLTKRLRPPIQEFQRKVRQNAANLPVFSSASPKPEIEQGDAQHLPLPDSSVDLIVTSPPYAANAIDYMRAHKFSLVWMGYPIDRLGQRRGDYIGGEATSGFGFEDLPPFTAQVIDEITAIDEKKGAVLHRYYSEMTRVLAEMLRVLKPGKAAVLVVGSSTMRGRDTRTERCLADIGHCLGFGLPRIGVRNLDRNRRMMPAGATVDPESQIEQRMHEEYVIGFVKPLARSDNL